MKDVPGNIAEFGVFKGYSLAAIARHANNRRILGFDSWGGLPNFSLEDACGQRKNRYPGSLHASKDDVIRTFKSLGLDLSNVKLIQGWFHETIGELKSCSLALVNLDVDLYESYRFVLNYIWPLLPPGGIVSIDEYSDTYWPGAKIAIDEFLLQDSVKRFFEIQKHPTVDRYFIRKLE